MTIPRRFLENLHFASQPGYVPTLGKLLGNKSEESDLNYYYINTVDGDI